MSPRFYTKQAVTLLHSQRSKKCSILLKLKFRHQPTVRSSMLQLKNHYYGIILEHFACPPQEGVARYEPGEDTRAGEIFENLATLWQHFTAKQNVRIYFQKSGNTLATKSLLPLPGGSYFPARDLSGASGHPPPCVHRAPPSKEE